MLETKIICLTPVRNEAWILGKFLDCTSLWADLIIIADQGSDDGSREIAARYPKVTVIDNAPGYDEARRQNLLITAARRIPGRRVLVTLDADEILSANWASSPDWERLISAPPGNVFWLPMVNLLPGCELCWLRKSPFAFVDDGTEHKGQVIHSFRVPTEGKQAVELKDICVLHYQYADWDRMESKHRWYQCWELLSNPSVSSVELYRKYHHMDSISWRELEPVEKSWMAAYEDRGIDMRSVKVEKPYRWDMEVVRMFLEHGRRKFRKLAIWQNDWESAIREAGFKERSGAADPRSWLDRKIQVFLRFTQPFAGDPLIMRIDSWLRRLGW